MQEPSASFQRLFEQFRDDSGKTDHYICRAVARLATTEEQTVTNLIWLFLVGLEGLDARTSVLSYVLEMFKNGFPMELLQSTTAALCDQKNLPKGVNPWTEELFNNEDNLSIELLKTLFGKNQSDDFFAFCMCVVPANAQLLARILQQIFKFRCEQVDGDFDTESWDGYRFKGQKPYLTLTQREALREAIISSLDTCPPTADVFHAFSTEQQLLILKRTSDQPNTAGCTVSAWLLMSAELNIAQQRIVTVYVSKAVTRPATCEDPGGAAAYVGLLAYDHLDRPGKAQKWADNRNDKFVRELMRAVGNEFARLTYDGNDRLVATILNEGLGRSLEIILPAPSGMAVVWRGSEKRFDPPYLLKDGDWVIVPRALFRKPEEGVAPARREVFAAIHPFHLREPKDRLWVVYPAKAF